MTPFDGSTYDPTLDRQRLTTLLGRVQRLMSDNRWRTLSEVQTACGGTEASCSARLRDLRKDEYGGFEVERRRVGRPVEGRFEYRVLARTGQMSFFT